MIETDTIRMRILEQGSGPLVLLLHGFPGLSHVWHHQLAALAAAGYHAVAPDMRGYGGTEAPAAVEAYDMFEVSADVIALMDALGEESAVLVGHDWGAFVAWSAALIYPERFRRLVAISVPFSGRGDQPPLEAMRAAAGDNFNYVVYYQEPGVAEAEFDPDPRALFERVFVSPGQELEPPTIQSPAAGAGGLLGRLGRARELPAWFSEADMRLFVETFARTGFRGGLNYYRALDRTFHRSAHLAGATVDLPVLFLGGERDLLLGGASQEDLRAVMAPVVRDLEVVLYPDAGHWVALERAADVNAAILGFLRSGAR